MKIFPEKMAFLGDVCVEKIDFFGKFCRKNGLFWKVVVEKMGCAGDKMKTIAVLRPHPAGALPICALQRAHTQSAMRVPHLNSPQCQIDSELP